MLQAGDPPPEEVPDGADRPERARGANGAACMGGGHERLAIFDAAVAEISARVESDSAQADGWLEQTRAGVQELLRFCDERPAAARSLVVDSIAWGREVLLRRGQLLDTLAEALARGESYLGAESPGTAELPGTAENLVGACVSLVHTRLLQAGSGTTLLELAPSLMSMIVHPYLGPEAARRELERSLAKAGKRTPECESDGSVARVRERSY